MLNIVIKFLIKKAFGKAPYSKLLVFSFHDVYEGKSDFTESSSLFGKVKNQIYWIHKYFDILPLAEGVDLCRKGLLKKPTACLTFDDGYYSHYQYILPLLTSLDIKASFFITSKHFGNSLLWNDLLLLFYKRSSISNWKKLCHELIKIADAKSKKSVDYAYMERIFKYLCLEKRNVIINKINLLEDMTISAQPRMLGVKEVIELQISGMSIGGHTVNHPILSKESTVVAKKEIIDNLEDLHKITQVFPLEFAIPNGKPKLDFSDEHLDILSESGVKYVVTTSPGYFEAGSDPMQIPRISLTGNNSLSFLKSIIANYKSQGDFIECRGYERDN
ncbi:hypothetical protein CMT41_18215 [Colwellia sp. MT41]|uniref:polysaccharide deacetylase family protein n=1 Tax=Colwellia sp. MT41 TaxID=58049 RepID=UPI00071774E4|nr:polysaccharide deacetylase family protein [Colwellia sp. MT41]ALO36460.1 hypothetical protein CMT41_18215 [Colwellia sp. MT41]